MKERWSSFKRRIRINCPKEEVYKCWACSEKLEMWFLERADFLSEEGLREKDEFLSTGDSFKWKWHNWDFTEEGSILETNGENLISFTFGQGGNVSIELIEFNSSTEVLLTQYDIPSDDDGKLTHYVGCITGWTFWLTNLKAFLEHGITLHAQGLDQNETTDLVNS